MKKSFLLLSMITLAAASGTAEAGWFGKLPGGSGLFSKFTSKVVTPQAAPETCYRFAYRAENRDGVENIFSGGNCLSESENLTRNEATAHFAHLGVKPGTPEVDFQRITPGNDDLDTPDLPQEMNVFDLSRHSWIAMDTGTTGDAETPHLFEIAAQVYDASGRLAILSRENDGHYALRMNDGPYYAAAGSRVVRDFGMVPAQDMKWVPIPGQSRPRFLVVSFGNTYQAAFRHETDMYVLDTENPGDPVSLEEAAPSDLPMHAMRGSQPALKASGAEMFFVRNHRILNCELDLSHMDDESPRAYCANSREPERLHLIAGEMASPTVSFDGEWLYFSMKTPYTTSWDIYRSRFDRLFLEPVTSTTSVDETEVISVAPWMEYTATTAQTYMTVKEEPKYTLAPSTRTSAQVITP